MAAALPVSKLVGLLVKTLAKPMAKRIKHECHRSPTTSRILTSFGQATHQITSRMTIWASGYKVRKVNALEEDEAMKRGAEFLGESVVFLVAGAVVVVEYNSSKAKDKAKEEKRVLEAEQNAAILEARLKAIDVKLNALDEQIKMVRKIVYDERGSSTFTTESSTDSSIKSSEPGSSDNQGKGILNALWTFSRKS